MPMSCAWEPGQLAPAQLPHDILEKIVKLAIGYIASQKSSSNSSSSSSTEEHDVSSSIAPDAHLWLHSSFTLARAVCAAHVSRMAINVGLPSADSLQQFAGAFGAFPRLAALHELSLSLADTQLPPLLRVPAMATRLHALRSLSLITKGDCGIDLGAVAEACPVLQRLVLLAEPGSSCGAGASPARFEGSHSLSGLSRLTSLTDLTLVPPCGITEPGLRALSCLPALSCLYVSPRAPVDVALLCAAGVPRLASLTLHYAHVARDSGHVHVAADLAGLSTLTRLCVLDFGGLVDLRDATFGALLACCPHLQALVLDNYCVRGAACVDALSRMPELATLGVHSLEPFGSVEPAAGVDASSPHARGGGTERACCAWRHLELSEMPTPEHLVRLPLAGLTELRLPPDLPNACWELGIAGSGADVGATAAHVRGAARVLRPLLSQPLGLLLAWFEAPRVACAAVLASLQPVAHYLEELTLEAWPLGGDTLHALPRVAPHVVGLTLDACGPLAWDGWRALLKMRGLRVLRVRAPVAADDVVAFSLAAAHPVVVYLDAGSLSAEELQRAQQHVHTCRQPPPPPHGAALETATAGSRAGVAWLGMDQVSNTPAYLVNAW